MNSDTRMNDEDEHIITNKQQDNAILAFLCGLVIALAILISAFARGCHPAPAVADCICEECGQVIGAVDHGRCHPSELAKLETGNLKLGGRTCE